MIPNLDVLGSLARDLHHSLSNLFYLIMPVMILLSVVITYLKSGDPDFPEIIKRSLVAALLLVSFPEVSTAILDLHKAGVEKVIMLSGDNQTIVSNIASQVGIDQSIGELLPEDKVERVKECMLNHHLEECTLKLLARPMLEKLNL